MSDRQTAAIVGATAVVVALYVLLVPVLGAGLGVPGLAGEASEGLPFLGGAEASADDGGGGYDTAQTFHPVPSQYWNNSVEYHNDRSAIGFQEVSSEVGLTYQYTQTYRSTQEVTSNTGVYAADYDRDGWTDLLAVGGEQPALYRNTGGAFERTSQLPEVDGIVQSAFWVDYDADGWRDLLLLRADARPVVLRNDEGDLQRVDAGMDASLFMPHGATAADFDGDGCPSVFVVQYGHWGQEHPYGQFNYSVDLGQDNAAPNLVFGGDCESLSNATEGTGVRGTAWSLATSAVDVTGDGAPDVHVTNDFNHDVIYENSGNGTFERQVLGNRTNRNGMSSEVADVNGDGLADIFVTNIYFPRHIRQNIEVSLDIRAAGNNLLVNDGSGGFDERAAEYGVRRGGWGWASTLTDFDNDGDRDLLHTTRMINRNQLQENFLTDEHQTIERFLRYPVLRERTDDGFARLNASRAGLQVGNGRGLAELDYDRDGNMDVVVADANGPLNLYENTYDGDGGALQVALDPAANQTSLGATVAVETGSERQTQWHNAKSDYLSQDTQVLHFGTGSADTATVTVTWPDGTEQTVADVATDQRVVVSPDGSAEASAFAGS